MPDVKITWFRPPEKKKKEMVSKEWAIYAFDIVNKKRVQLSMSHPDYFFMVREIEAYKKWFPDFKIFRVSHAKDIYRYGTLVRS